MQEFIATINAALTLVCSTMTPVYYGEPVYYEEPTCYEEPADYGQACEPGEASDFKSQGVVYEDGTTYTWYSENVLPGGGLDELNANGRTVDGNGFVVDGDGYIAVASSDLEMGTVIETPWGEAKVYDTGCASGVIDVYTSW